jgi:hypothetical protein
VSLFIQTTQSGLLFTNKAQIKLKLNCFVWKNPCCGFNGTNSIKTGGLTSYSMPVLTGAFATSS